MDACTTAVYLFLALCSLHCSRYQYLFKERENSFSMPPLTDSKHAISLQAWTGKIERPLRVWQRPRITDDIYLHFSELLKGVRQYAPRIYGVVLDIGAGKMPYRHLFRYDRYIAFENHAYPHVDIVGDVTKRIPLPSAHVDSVVCFQVLEHLPEPGKAINEIYRVLKKGGVCLLTTHLAAPLHGLPHDYYRFTPFAFKHLFRKFSHIEIRPQGGAALSIMQLLIWGISEKLPRPLALPCVISMNLLGKLLDRLLYTSVFTLNYTVFATK
jgi:SAM-dependent methyltransferase